MGVGWDNAGPDPQGPASRWALLWAAVPTRLWPFLAGAGDTQGPAAELTVHSLTIPSVACGLQR